MKQRRLTLFLPLVLLLLGWPTTVHAHGQIKWSDAYIGGLLHPITTPAHLLILLGLGLWLGQRSPMRLTPPITVLLVSSALALAFTAKGWIASVYPPLLTCLALSLGILVALQKKLPPMAMFALFAAAGLFIGGDSGFESDSRRAIFKSLLGTWLAINLLVTVLAIHVETFSKRDWQKIGIRVMGSWIIAISLLVLAFSLRKP